VSTFEEREVAVVTGGASGIGAACARALARYGCKVVVADLDRAAAQRVAAELGGVAEELDVAREASVEDAAARIEGTIGPVGVLVNSAGVLQRPLPPEELELSSWDHVIAVDQRGTYVASAAFGRRMARRGRGVIVNIASVTGLRSAPLHAYAPAKAAVISMTECLAAEWGRSGVRVNAVSPGYTRTPALQAAIDRGQRDGALLAGAAALGRLVEPDEVAEAVAFLASNEAAAITGVNLPVDAGWLVAPSWGTYGGLRGRR
jgi:NAD(P)-dependent dehydrogenase (short-subunit alcohol dehydrogenase family)